MIGKFFKVFACMLAFLLSCPLFAEVRTWTTTDGKTMEGEYVDATDDTVTILSKGKERKVKLSKLSEEDVEYVQERRSKEGKNKANNNFSARWPSSTTMEDKLKAKPVKEDPENGEYIYETSHFRFYSPVKLNMQTVSEMGRIFEGTFTACKAIPLNFPCRRYNFNKDVDEEDSEGQEKLVARLFLTKADYAREVGPAHADSAGLFRGAQGDVLVPFESLGITKKGSSYAIGTGKKQDAGTLIHELTHQMSLYGATYDVPIWFAEGMAEYMSLADYSRGRFNFKAVGKNIKPYIIGGPGIASRNLGKSFTSPHLQDFMNMSTREFQSASGDQIQFNYGFSTLLLYYFAHLDGKGDGARLRRWMRAVQETQRPSVSIPANASPSERAAAQERLRQMSENPDYHYDILLDGRSWGELEAEFAKKVRKLGIDVKFR